MINPSGRLFLCDVSEKTTSVKHSSLVLLPGFKPRVFICAAANSSTFAIQLSNIDVARPSLEVSAKTGNRRAVSPCFKNSGNFIMNFSSSV